MLYICNTHTEPNHTTPSCQTIMPQAMKDRGMRGRKRREKRERMLSITHTPSHTRTRTHSKHALEELVQKFSRFFRRSNYAVADRLLFKIRLPVQQLDNAAFRTVHYIHTPSNTADNANKIRKNK